ncbi:hypothetical protein J6590_055523 [Homalodisca vitripennis]|nr:hypothetical protein J6590_055523 [Homalodisca vitripennis]
MDCKISGACLFIPQQITSNSPRFGYRRAGILHKESGFPWVSGFLQITHSIPVGHEHPERIGPQTDPEKGHLPVDKSGVKTAGSLADCRGWQP